MVSYLIFPTSNSKAKNENTIPCLRKLPSTIITMQTAMKHLMFCIMVSTKQRDEFHTTIEEITP